MTNKPSKIFVPNRSLGYVSNNLPLLVRYIKRRQENLVVTCVGRSFHTYGISHFGLLSVSGLHPGDITCIAADTYHVYTACNNSIYAWRRGTELKHTYKNKHKRAVYLMLPFGVHLIAIDKGGSLKVWDIKNESVFLELTFNNETFEISTILHPSTYINKILLGSRQGEMQLWNMNSAKLIYSFKGGWKENGLSISCLEQAPALDVVAVGLSNGEIILHNLKYDESVMKFKQDWGMVTSISFRTDSGCNSAIMASGSVPGHIVFWDLEERKVFSQILNAHDGPVTGMECLTNEPLILTSSPDNTLKLWIFDQIISSSGAPSAPPARLLRIREGHSAPPTKIRFHGVDGNNILSAGHDSTLRIFNTKTEQFNKSLGKALFNRKQYKKEKNNRSSSSSLIMPPIIEFTSEIIREKEWDNIAAIHNGLAIVTTWSYDKIKMGELKLLAKRFQKHYNDDDDVIATCLNLSHCGNFVIIGYSTGHIDRFNMQSGLWRDSYGKPKAHETSIRGICSDQLNQILISGGYEGFIKFWKFKNNSSSSILNLINLNESISFFRIHSDSSMLAVALENFNISIIDIESRRIVRKFDRGHIAPITDATFSPDSRWLITSSMDCTIKTWDIPSATLIDQFSTENACISLNLSPNGQFLATAHIDYLGIFLWANRTLYKKITLKALNIDEKPHQLLLPLSSSSSVPIESISIIKNEQINKEQNKKEEEEEEEDNVDEYLSPKQIHNNLLTLSGLPTSRWLNLLNIDIIKQKNKPKQTLKIPKNAPFFLPSFSSCYQNEKKQQIEILSSSASALTLTNLTEFGKLLLKEREVDVIIEKLKSFSPSMIDFEIKSLESVKIMLEFMKSIEYMLMSNRDFELAQAYLSVFLKVHGRIIGSEEKLKNYLQNIQTSHNIIWNKLNERLLYSICIVKNLKTVM